MVTLRDGREVDDPRLDRLTWFDPTSRDYPVRALVAPLEPVTRTWACDRVLDQGAEGACVGFAVTHELLAEPEPVPGLDAAFAREQIYWEAQKIDPWAGGAYPGADPFMEGSAVLAGMKVAESLGYILQYRWAFGLDDLVTAVGNVGPAVLGVNWYEGMYEPGADGFIRPTGALVGGHAIAFVGVNVEGYYFEPHNSWGDDWGDGGRCKISFDDVARLLAEDGEACIPVTRAAVKRLDLDPEAFGIYAL